MKSHCVSYNCVCCGKKYSRKADLIIHSKKCVSLTNNNISNQYFCKHCGMIFPNYDSLFSHVVGNHPLQPVTQKGGSLKESNLGEHGKVNSTKSTGNEISAVNKQTEVEKSNNSTDVIKHNTEKKNALNNTVQVMNIYPNDVDQYDILLFYTNIQSEVLYHLQYRRQQFNQIKWYLNTKVRFSRFR